MKGKWCIVAYTCTCTCICCSVCIVIAFERSRNLHVHMYSAGHCRIYPTCMRDLVITELIVFITIIEILDEGKGAKWTRDNYMCIALTRTGVSNPCIQHLHACKL